MKKLLIVCIFVGLAACVGDAQTRATAALGIACDTYATVLDQLTPKKATMSAANVAKIDKINAVTKPACLPGSPIDPAALVATVQSAITLLNSIKGN